MSDDNSQQQFEQDQEQAFNQLKKGNDTMEKHEFTKEEMNNAMGCTAEEYMEELSKKYGVKAAYMAELMALSAILIRDVESHDQKLADKITDLTGDLMLMAGAEVMAGGLLAITELNEKIDAAFKNVHNSKSAANDAIKKASGTGGQL